MANGLMTKTAKPSHNFSVLWSRLHGLNYYVLRSKFLGMTFQTKIAWVFWELYIFAIVFFLLLYAEQSVDTILPDCITC